MSELCSLECVPENHVPELTLEDKIDYLYEWIKNTEVMAEEKVPTVKAFVDSMTQNPFLKLLGMRK